jgi:death-on-curing family protein
VRDLARDADIDIDEALVTLWIEDIDADETSFINQRDLRKARRAVGLEDDRQVLTVDYWLDRSGMTRDELTKALSELGLTLSPQARKIPRNGLRRLRSLFPGKVQVLEIREVTQDETTYEPLMWVQIGSGQVSSYLTEQDVLTIHEVLADEAQDSGDPIEPPGLKSEIMLSSALSRPLTSLGDELKYPTPEMAGAALFHSIVHNHAFFNGNKRTGLVALIVFLDRNGKVLTCSQEELLRVTLTLAKHGLVTGQVNELADREVLELARWIRLNSRAVQRGERVVKWHRLKGRLKELGCSFEPAPGVGHRLNIMRSVNRRTKFGRTKIEYPSVQVAFSGDGTEAEKSVIHHIRARLELDDAHGVDSAKFYDGAEIDEWIAAYRQVLKRLARL